MAWLAVTGDAHAAWSVDLGPLGYLSTAGGGKGGEVTALLWALLLLSIAVVLITSGLVLAGLALRRSRHVDVAAEPVSQTGGGLRWIVIGTGVSTVALFGAMVWNGYTMAAINRPPREPSLTIEVRGHQWWWEFTYRSGETSRTFTTANEIHIPVGEPVRFRVTTSDVIHSFWAPALGDKMDLIPNQENTLWLEADRAGVYRGQCAEYCGKQHAYMGLLVVAEPADAFRKWWDGQLAPAPQADSEGARNFLVRCGGCHAVRGTLAAGRVGPDLSHLMTRRTIAAGALPNTIGHLSGWIADPQGVKPGNLMPDLELSGRELASIRDYLGSLN